MNPRYKKSLKWTAFPQELVSQIKAIYDQNFSKSFDSHTTLSVDGRIYQKEILLRVSLHKKGELKHFNFESSIDLTSSTEDILFAQISAAVDCLGSLVAEYIENDFEIELPYVWTETQFEKKSLWIQHSTENPKLEEEANKLLGLAEDDALLKNADDVDHSDDILDTTEDEFDEFAAQITEHGSVNMAKPQMFNNKKKDDLH